MVIKKVDFILLINIVICLSMLINGFFIRGVGEFRESEWHSGKIGTIKCKRGRFSEHSIKMAGDSENIIILIDDLSCQDLKKLSQNEVVKVLVEYGYGNVAYSPRIETEERKFISRENKAHLSDGKYLNGVERLILIGFIIYFITRFFRYLRETKLSI
ncbi:hypothetical protein J8L98_03395 [Pseudoalteromonas sp. MMG013]|uniref:hypothetical protein n=1 Tax=Pseudoalteromonas sp. MMG013 TaxID=2822687 RepID=UPI001B36EE49|nr:hypothetical protein [Pseudoalteromonas sp. MMG013]MBQ4860741.1 hypothetical protein [Pseudoalteromonas sp. MMG013]